MNISHSRRRLLGLAGVGVSSALSGCSLLASSSSARYSLQSSPRGGTTLLDLFEWEPRQQALHVRRHADALVAELLDSGEMTTEAQPLGPYDPNGSPPLAYTEYEGSYYSVRVTAVEEVSLDRWEFWFEPVEQAPADVDPVENLSEGLSDFDAEIADRAVAEAMGAVVDGVNLSTVAHGERGVVFFDPMDPAESELVPNPPFEYVRAEPDNEFLDEKQTLRAHATDGNVKTKRYVHETERVADSKSELEDVLSGHIDATFGEDPEDIREILDETIGGVYAEREPISESFESLIAQLGIDDPTPPDESGASRAWRRHYEYEGDYYATTLRIRND
ncbi:hypothetical protein [Halorussus ruber]|uniref:hypothetical protein n=1 Tax=Halorussus ruber TaxID=1126238 RepID=UPI001091ACA4|nr:hypothetical protein [Halorussus ruber]